MDKICAVILAAGRGTRMNSTEFNKVTIPIAGKPIIQRDIEVLRGHGIKDIVVVVGFAKESVTVLLDDSILIAEQKQTLGTGHATSVALPKVPLNDEYVLVLYGDDAFWFTSEILDKLVKTQEDSDADITFCTTILENPQGLGRIIRNGLGEAVNIIEEKVATEQQKEIREINLGGFLFKKSVLSENIDKLPKNPVSGEYYLTDIIRVAIAQKAKVKTLKIKGFTWRGINTPEELKIAEKLLH